MSRSCSGGIPNTSGHQERYSDARSSFILTSVGLNPKSDRLIQKPKFIPHPRPYHRPKTYSLCPKAKFGMDNNW